MASKAVRITVTGIVQGVGFRYFTMHEAVKLGLNGYASNLSTGQVEIAVSGEKGMIEEFVKIVRIGPRHAHIDNVEVEEILLKEPFSSFYIR